MDIFGQTDGRRYNIIHPSCNRRITKQNGYFWLLENMAHRNQRTVPGSWLQTICGWKPKKKTQTFQFPLAPQKLAGDQKHIFSVQLAPTKVAGDQNIFLVPGGEQK